MTRQYLLACASFFLYFPLGIPLHELGHLAAAKSLGWNARFSYRRVSVEGENLTDAQMIRFKASGPLVDVALTCAGVIALAWCNTKQRAGAAFWLSTALALTSLRWLKVALQGHSSDESKVSELLGLPWWALPLAMLCLSIPVWTFVLAVHTRRGTLRSLGAALACALVGVALWIGVVGPALFPLPA